MIMSSRCGALLVGLTALLPAQSPAANAGPRPIEFPAGSGCESFATDISVEIQ